MGELRETDKFMLSVLNNYPYALSINIKPGQVNDCDLFTQF